MIKKYILVEWPDSQYLMEMDWFDKCILMNDENQFENFGSSAYFVPEYLYIDFLLNHNHKLKKDE
jgi:hypothetical protein